MSATGRSDVRRPDDFYSTPSWCVRAILPHLHVLGRTTLDPCAGDGAILHAVQVAHPASVVRGIEIDPGRRLACIARGLLVHHGDALDETPWREAAASDVPIGLVITNPPYSTAEEFLCRSLDEVGFGTDGMMRGTVALLLRINWLASKGRVWLHRKHPCDLFVLPKRPSFTGKGTDATEYAWFVWGPGRGGRWSILDVEADHG